MKSQTIRALRRRGHKEGAKIAEDVIAQVLKEIERDGSLSSEIEGEIMAMLHNKIARAQRDLTAGGAGPVAVEQFGIACLAECVARFRARQSLVAAGTSGRLH